MQYPLKGSSLAYFFMFICLILFCIYLFILYHIIAFILCVMDKLIKLKSNRVNLKLTFGMWILNMHNVVFCFVLFCFCFLFCFFFSLFFFSLFFLYKVGCCRTTLVFFDSLWRYYRKHSLRQSFQTSRQFAITQLLITCLVKSTDLSISHQVPKNVGQ